MTANTMITWKTTKKGNAFVWIVERVTKHTEPQENGRYATSELVKTGARATRAQAKGAAQRWVRYLKAGGKA